LFFVFFVFCSVCFCVSVYPMCPCFGYSVFRVSASLCWVASALRSPVRFEVLRILCPVLSYSLLSSFSFFVRLTCHNFKRVFHPLKYFTVPVHMSQCHVVKMSTFLSICHPVICDWSFSVLWSDLSISSYCCQQCKSSVVHLVIQVISCLL